MSKLDNREEFKKFFNVSRETISMFILFETIIKEFGNKHNIISKNSMNNIWSRHFADSAKIFSILHDVAFPRKEILSICDVGSGAGFPGIVLAILNTERKMNFNLTLVESNEKKINFLLYVIEKLQLNVDVKNARVENMNKKFDLITARAFAPLKRIFENTSRIISPKTLYVLPKGKSWKEEINQIKKKWNYEVNIVKNNKIIDKSGGVTLIIKKLRIK